MHDAGSTIQDSSFSSKFYVKLFVTTRDRGASGGHIKNHTRSLNYGLVRIGPDINGKAITSRWSGFFFQGVVVASIQDIVDSI